MRLTDAIIIYLALAAPFGTYVFLSRNPSRRGLARKLFSALLYALAWPASALVLLRPNICDNRSDDSEERDVESEQKVERLQREMASTLSDLEKAFSQLPGGKDERLRFTLFAARESVLRFVGLARAAQCQNPSARPTTRELELCRVAGRTGEDLQLAGRCVHRRNVLRLRLQRDRARNDVLRALSEVERFAADAHKQLGDSTPATLRISEVLTRLRRLAVELFTAIEDPRALEGVARIVQSSGNARLRQAPAPVEDARYA